MFLLDIADLLLLNLLFVFLRIGEVASDRYWFLAFLHAFFNPEFNTEG
jgi:hypothetical protein